MSTTLAAEWHVDEPQLRATENDARAALAAVTGLAPLDGVDDVRVDWRWIPAWRPADITDSGREQLRAIGFTL